MAGPAGIEPVTDGLRVRCSTLLSYGPHMVSFEQVSIEKYRACGLL